MDYKELLTREGLVLAALPIFGFIAALAFEYGYAVNFGYPLALIVIDLRMTLTSLILGLIYLYVIWLILDFVVEVVAEGGNAGRFVRAISPMLLLVVLLLFGTGFHEKVFEPALWMFSAVCIITILGVAFEARKVGLSAAFEKVAEDMVGPPIKEKKKTLRIKFFDMAFPIAILVFLIFGAGKTYGQMKRQFSYFEIGPDRYIILAVYGDSVVGARLVGGKPQEDFAVIGKTDDSMKKVGTIAITSKEQTPDDKEPVSPTNLKVIGT